MTDLILIRHGETEFNREGRFQGGIDAPLNEHGRRQAERLAAQLAGERIDALHCSDLLRARQTAAPAAFALGLTAQPDARLREQGFGVLEGLTFAEAREHQPAALAVWARHQADGAPPGGETVRAFHDRVVAAVRDIAARHAGRRIAVVTHGGVLDMLWRTSHGLPLDGPRTILIPNTGLNRFSIDADRMEITGWGEDGHLTGLER